MITPDPLLRHRAEFPILEHSTDLISNPLGAMPRAAAAELDRAYVSIDEIRATGAWRRWLNRPAVVT